MKDKDKYYTFNEYMKSNQLTPSEEDYIEMIYRLSLEREKIQVKNISQSLNIKPPSVTKMIKKLEKKNLLIYTKYEPIKLTYLGIIIGEKLLNRHNIIYEFLEIISLNDSIHEETEKIEHTISYETLVNIETLTRFFKDNKDIFGKLVDYQKAKFEP